MAATIEEEDRDVMMEMIRNGRWDDLEHYIKHTVGDINAFHITSNMFDVNLVMMVHRNEISLGAFVKTIDLFISSGLDPELVYTFYDYFKAAIHTYQHQMIRFLILRTGNYLLEYFDSSGGDRRFVSIFYLALVTGDPITIKIFIDAANIDVNQSVRWGNRYIFPVCVLIRENHLAALKYIVNIGANIDIPECFESFTRYGRQPVQSGNSTQKLVNDRGTPEIKRLYKTVLENVSKKPLSLEALSYVTVINNDIRIDDVQKIIQSDNYIWLLTTNNQDPRVLKARSKIVRFTSIKRQREDEGEETVFIEEEEAEPEI